MVLRRENAVRHSGVSTGMGPFGSVKVLAPKGLGLIVIPVLVTGVIVRVTRELGRLVGKPTQVVAMQGP